MAFRYVAAEMGARAHRLAALTSMPEIAKQYVMSTRRWRASLGLKLGAVRWRWRRVGEIRLVSSSWLNGNLYDSRLASVVLLAGVQIIVLKTRA